MTSYRSDSPDTIVLIHGLWMSPLSWEKWIERYGALAYRVLAAGWPGIDGDIDQFRADPSAVDTLGIEEIIDRYDAIIRELDTPPIIMGTRSAARSPRCCSTAGSARPASASTPRR